MYFLDVRLKKFTEEKQQLSLEVQNLQLQLDNLKSQKGRYSNGPSGEDDDYDAQSKFHYFILYS